MYKKELKMSFVMLFLMLVSIVLKWGEMIVEVEGSSRYLSEINGWQGYVVSLGNQLPNWLYSLSFLSIGVMAILRYNQKISSNFLWILPQLIIITMYVGGFAQLIGQEFEYDLPLGAEMKNFQLGPGVVLLTVAGFISMWLYIKQIDDVKQLDKN